MPDYTGLKKTLGEMLQKKQQDKANEDRIRQDKNDGDRNKILENVGKDFGSVIQPFIDKMGENSRMSFEELKRIISESVQVTAPNVDTSGLERVMQDAFSNLKFPEPRVSVAAPVIPAPVIRVNPPSVNFPSEMSLKPNAKPFPVIMMDQAGKPMMFPQSMGASGGRSDFFTIRDIQTSSGASLIDQVDGLLKVGGNFSISASNSSTQAIDSSGNVYSQANPFPTSASLSVPQGQGDSATAMRIIQAGDSVSSVVVNSGTITTVTTLTGITNTIAAMNVDSTGVAYSGSNPVPVTLANTGSNQNVNLVGGGSDSMFVRMARTTNPTAVSDGADVRAMADKLGRTVMRPVHVRDLIATAYVTLSTGTEATLLAASAGNFFDLISVIAANTSTAAQQLDIRATTAGNIVQTLYIPAQATAGWTPPVPWPQDNQGNNWTVDMADVTNSNIIISALFSKEI